MDIHRREQAVIARERELAEQRKVLAEEYRLLRARDTLSPVAAPAARREDVPLSTVAAPNAARFDAARVESFWDRLKRIMLGVPVS